VLLIDIFFNFIDDIYLIFLIPHMQKYAVLVSAFRFADKILAILHCPKQNLHLLINMEEGLNVIYFTINAVEAV